MGGKPGADVKSGSRKNSDNPALWALAHAERAALADDLATLTPEQWQHPTLCGDWNVEQVVAHLTAAASLNQRRWLRSMVAARFRADVHNQRQLELHRGGTPAQTLGRFRAIVDSTTAPSNHTAAYLGEVVVHAQDIRQPLGLPYTPSVEALTPVAEFFASRDFAVPSRTMARDLQLRASDGPFITGYGLLVTGPTLALVMSIAGRAAYLNALSGPGAATLRTRVLQGGSGSG
ncbi:maleylpyruvate isomerase family mycothiol-dependent enzyme [Arthrobacter jiangjiafuii]|uniref:Maleylpyruvate isomerase family mycothiol-dependent enzyme n=1 Tax=Arthrobacter jiangjiafuii TaxID=2817475 RepID=A0A975M7R0_9MICC|nr:maleylpyruvate isomerase family mycothiol-dependent enzyme [Arthrobacter jiangjiafuii]MBP3042976.1 maleylpyruvate isomerase family mycothiol-dependent enzyme [Arthrobacter jiangjiafuii]QWC11500.1 maleylpyruvate isomerase family mycothiol-dependent enzyme [Arthrobacter jiangjiafuii]